MLCRKRTETNRIHICMRTLLAYQRIRGVGQSGAVPDWKLQWWLANRKAGGMEATQHVRGITRRRLRGHSKPRDVYCCQFFYFVFPVGKQVENVAGWLLGTGDRGMPFKASVA